MLAISFIWLFGCSQVTPSVAGEQQKIESKHASIDTKGDRLAAVFNQIQQLSSDNQCKVKSDCGLLEIGHRACGGPAGYEVYSQLNPQKDKLLELAKTHQAMQRKENIKSGRMSTCEVIPEPLFGCVNHQCTVVNGDAF